MFDLERWGEIFEVIRKNKTRTFLTGVSVASGIFILVILLGVVTGMRNGINEAFAGTSISQFSVRSGRTEVEYKGLRKGRQITLMKEDYEALRQIIGPFIDMKSPVVNSFGITVSYKEKNVSYPVFGIYPDQLVTDKCELTTGRALGLQDNQAEAKVAYIGKTVKTELFGEQDPLNELIMINNVPFKVIGTYTNKSGNWGENKIYIPYDIANKIFGKYDELNSMSFTMKPASDMSEYLRVANGLFSYVKTILKLKYAVSPEDSRGIQVNSMLEEAKKIYAMLDTMDLFSWIVGICTMLSGVVGVSNIMFIIIKERTREIGIRKALGARPASIVGVILHEAIFLTFISGFVGLLCAISLLSAVGPHINSRFFKNPTVDFGTAISAIIVLVVCGALAGFIPAYKAAKIKPVDALSKE